MIGQKGLKQARRPRRVYRFRPLVWFGPLLAVTTFVMYLMPNPGLDWRAPALMGALGIGLIWISWRPHVVIERDGLRALGLVRSRFVTWPTIEAVAYRPHGRSKTECVVITVSGRSFALTAPASSRYAREAAEDIEAAWRAAVLETGAVSTTVPTARPAPPDDGAPN